MKKTSTILLLCFCSFVVKAQFVEWKGSMEYKMFSVTDSNSKVVMYQKNDSPLVIIDTIGSIKTLIKQLNEALQENRELFRTIDSLRRELFIRKPNFLYTSNKKQ